MGNYLFSLNGIKVLALLAIFWWHSSAPNPYLDLGARGCDLLFVISGYLTMHNYRGIHCCSDYVRYLNKKISKVYPLYIICILLVIILMPETVPFNIWGLKKFIVNILMLQGWTDITSINGPTWFISVLMGLYFISPIICNYILRLEKYYKPIFAMVVIARIIAELCNGSIYSISMHSNGCIRLLDYIIGMLYCIGNKGVICHLSNVLYKTSVEIVFILCTIGIYLYFQNTNFRFIIILWDGIFVCLFARSHGGYISRFLSNEILFKFANIQMEFYILHQVAILLGYIIFKHFFGDINGYILMILTFFLLLTISYFYKTFFESKLNLILSSIILRLEMKKNV